MVKNVFEMLASSEFQHGPIKEGNCLACHTVHRTTYPNRLAGNFPETMYEDFNIEEYALCFSCHDKDLVLQPETINATNFRDGRKNLHFVHVNKESKGRTCRTCHKNHASNLPKLFRESISFGAIQWELPIGFVKAKTGGSCSPGCHKFKSYLRDQSSSPDSR